MTTAIGILLAACTPPVPAAPDPGDPLAAADVDATWTDDAGTTGPYRLIADEARGGRGVLLFFTADYTGPLYAMQAESRAELGAAHGLAVVAMANPDLPPGNDCWWAPAVSAYVRYVEQFLTDVLVPTYGVDPRRVFLTGLSGGSDFAAEFHYHTAFRYRGGSVALCGGDVPREDGGDCTTETDPPASPPPAAIPADALAGIRYDYAIDDTDPLYDASLASAAFYEAVGFAVTHRVVAGTGHCGFDDGFDGLGELADGLDRVDARVSR